MFRHIVVGFLICFVLHIIAANSIPSFDITSTFKPIITTSSPVSEFQSSVLWVLILGFVLAFTLSFGVGANDVANVFGTSVGAKVLTLRQACLIATFAEILGAILLGYSEELLPFVIAGFILSFILAFGVGANDVANSFGTSVGSGVLTLKRACILATIFESLGAILIGYKVSDTVRKGILDVSLYNNTEKELMLGSLAALGGSSLWNILATFLKLPISGTHTIVGATVGFTLCARGFNGVNWLTFLKIVASWFVSPVLSGLMSASIYMGINHFILKKEKPLEPGLRSLPFFYGFTILVNIFSIVHDGPRMLYLDNLPWWGATFISIGAGVLVALFVQLVIVPRQRKAITEYKGYESDVKFTIGTNTGSLDMVKEMTEKSPVQVMTIERISQSYKLDNSRSPTPPDLGQIEKGSNGQVNPATYALLTVDKNGYVPVSSKSSDSSLDLTAKEKGNETTLKDLSNTNSQVPLMNKSMTKEDLKPEEEEDSYEVSKLFSFLQILTATFGSFAHGGNDVSNAIGPLIAIWAIYTDGNVAQKSETPVYILLYGGLGISVGLWIWGRRVIQTIGENLTKVTPSSGFTIEIGSAFTVLMASKIGLPISTTHCKVGSVVFVGMTKSSRRGVDWKLFRNIVIAWVVTVPLTAGISALLMYIFRATLL